MKKKSSELNNEQKQNKNLFRITFRFLILAFIMLIIGGTCIVFNRFVTDLYTAFVLDFIAMSFLFSTVLTFCSFILYSVFVITVFNPQKIKKSSVAKFAIGGICIFTFTLFMIIFGVTEAGKSIQAMKDYRNGKWEVNDLVVMDKYREYRHPKMVQIRPSRMVHIGTSEGEMTLFIEDFTIHMGEKYRFTYLDATNTIIKVEKITD